ncbi:hypothetical protein [Metallosphaera hakonensis]|uniref:Ribbon-helix-helix protein, CopG family n=1 Tax=Metallosphaera hakonensis JCM 8857 = DSM 7519 TaxID=1293036 RepID=A0A2U9IW90_9CREN|nr:hypothetical protein [Metallosphaera hakonensis]AWS00309.1 hypothetical protein DFR87_12165 [Metallosphaera hakonensis JCM 8857 = DSM 7519]
MSEVISARLKKDVVKKIDELVSLGLFRSRNEALNFIISQGLKETEKWEEIMRKSKELNLPLLNKNLDDFLTERDRY